MKVLDLLVRHAGDGKLKLLAATAGGGVLAALVVTIVNAASAAGVTLGSWWRAAIFVLVLGGMYFARRLASKRLIDVFERASADLRCRFATCLREAPLRALETLGPRIERTTGDLAFLANTLESWVSGVQHLAFVLCITLAIGLMSGRALVLWCFTLGLLSVGLWTRLRRLRSALDELGGFSATLGSRVEQMVDGFVQAKLDGRVADGLADDIEGAAAALYGRQNVVEDIATRAFVGGFAVLFLVGSGVAAFAPSATIGFDPAEAYEMVIFYELSWAPLFGVLTAAPEMARAEAAARSVLDTIEMLPADDVGDERGDLPPPFATLELRQVEFAYDSAEASHDFVVGPLDLCIRRGELVLVTGGNGSGKTTMLKMLLGLYPPARGHLAVDGLRLAPGDHGSWRDRFTTIMSHQHLFDRLYGLHEVTPERMAELLARLGLTDIVAYRDQNFTDLALSTGQKMRLAMVAALLEDRPVYVFDEWTANQDPETTRWYYDVLLPELLAAGKTVVAVSHDDRFFDRADHLVRMDQGRIVLDHREPRP